MPWLAAFFLYALAEMALAAWVASLTSWLVVIGLFAAGAVLGIIVMRDAGSTAGTQLRQSVSDRAVASGDISSSGLKFLAGGLLFIPGFLTDVAGLTLLIPGVRRWGHRLGSLWVTRRVPPLFTNQSGRVVKSTVVNPDEPQATGTDTTDSDNKKPRPPITDGRG